jgi:hypothetical protein
MAPKKKPTDRFSPAQERAIVALLDQPTIKLAAEACGVCERTLYRWLNDSAFAKEYHQRKSQRYHQSLGAAQKFAPNAARLLMSQVVDSSLAPRVRQGAAWKLHKIGRDADHGANTERIRMLEQKVAELQKEKENAA